MSQVQLTQTVQKGGCAAKVPALELRKILSSVKFPPKDQRVLVDGGLFDDAGIYKINELTALVQTLDFFTPIVDDPYNFGAIAAANALSDVYAMGGIPKTTMAILAFPSAIFESEVIRQVLQGAADKIKEAKANLVGGHSIDDDTLKFGLSVTGLVHPQKIWSNNRAQVGDVLILTKPLGTGTLTAALKRQLVTEQDITDALDGMKALNNIIEYLDDTDLQSIHSATDITGFGLAGHAMQMAIASEVSFSVNVKKIPVYSKALDFLEQKILTKAHRTNGEYVEKYVNFVGSSDVEKLLMLDPQTSGGLLISVNAEKAQIILNKISDKFQQSQIIGTVMKYSNTNRVKFE